MRKLLLALVLMLTLAACAPVTPQSEATSQPTLPIELPTSAPTSTPVPVATNPIDPAALPAVNAARRALAGLLAIGFDEIAVASVESVAWPDGCLGVVTPGMMCNQMVTPGYRALLNAGPVQYEYHTTLDGSYVKIFGQPVVLSNSNATVLDWQSADCNRYSVTLIGASYGKCNDAALTSTQFIHPESLAIVAVWARNFKSFEADTPTGKVTFTGRGKSIATKSEQRMMAEWAALNYAVVSSGRAGAAWGIALTYHREGGIAGFCDDVYVYRTGLYNVSSCKQGDATTPNMGYLMTSELDALYSWLDGLQNIDYHYKDPAVADAMTTTLMLTGNGTQSARDDVVRSIVEFAANLGARANFSANASLDAFAARQTLTDFFAALNSGDFIKAAKLYGGDTALLATWNPDIKNNLPQWLERGCKQNGLQCLWPRSVTHRGPDVRGGYQFYVEFNNPDGTIFRQGGDAPGSVSNFIFSVIKQNDLWLVMDLPPYEP